MAIQTIDELKEKLLAKAERQLISAYGELEILDIELLEDYFDNAIILIRNWRNLINDYEFLQEMYNPQITRYIVRSFNERGIDGQSASNVGGDVKSFKTTPSEEMLNNIIQRAK